MDFNRVRNPELRRFFKDNYERVATIDITNAEIKDLDDNPKELVKAPGKDKLIQFVSATLYMNYGSEVLTGDYAMTIGYDDGSEAVAGTIAHGDFAHKDEDAVYIVNSALGSDFDASDVVNKNIALKSADDFGGNASDDTTWRVKVVYRVLDLKK